MPRAVKDEKMRKKSWPLLWADIHIPLDIKTVENNFEKGHNLRIEAEGPVKFDWFMII